ncbi:leucine-rich repeat domain-containing protein [Pseudomonas sp. S75]|uniref:leucine-rich repeat domain-containing protein n=1 Tax=unclassified Pseudomonas TaxID=196821 RepID=UPI001904690B|nr:MULTISPECIES: leucine-rich repeat domain-containing protein [unclassified Pseudomonas]MBJ9976470.1 leucine-rich repeat domain-containing protein [Pseudomonas sp. S30]MBK0155630.1 leucine-rich repeat domain-containing protein [Pseudomonas sp. S75]
MPLSDIHPHQHFLDAHLPAWATTLHDAHWQALAGSLRPAQGLPGEEADWFANAAPALRETLLHSQAELDQARHRLAVALGGLEQLGAFAERRLEERLRRDHGLHIPVRTTELIWLHHLFTHQVYVTHHERRSLLEAALHNFPANVEFSADSALALRGNATRQAITVTGTTTLGDSDTEVPMELDSERFDIDPLPLSPAQFAASCHQLDLGGLYQLHLDQQFAAPAVRPAAIALYQHSLRAAADLALLCHRIGGKARDAVLEVIAGNQTVTCRRLELFGVPLHEALVIDAGQAGLLLYVPTHEHSLRGLVDLPALQARLCQDLAAPDLRRALAACVDTQQRSTLLDRARQNLDSEQRRGVDAPWQLPDDADPHLRLLAIEGALFDSLFDAHLTRLKAEARLLAVPSAEADEQARRRRLALWEALGMDALMAASFFVPAVGGLMLGVTACQLLGEVYAGYQAWRVGDRHQALEHLKTTGLNLALIAGLGAVGAVAGKLSGTPLMQALVPVDLADGSQRLWLPALAEYRSPVALPEALDANVQGQFVDQGRHFIRLDGQLFEQRLDPDLQRWRIVHPQDPQAYAPLLEHNGTGAWRVEQEQPQTWDSLQGVRRLHPQFAQAHSADVDAALAITGLDDAALRRLHLQHLSTPPLLGDTLERLSLLREVVAELPEANDQDLLQAFTERYARCDLHADAQRLLSAYPELGPRLARRVLASGFANEAAAWPAPQARLDSLRYDLPLVRGLEGLQVPLLAGEATERLVFASLAQVPGWPMDLRLELRAASPQGPLLRRCGLPLAPRCARVIKTTAGYEADLGERPVALPASHDPLPAVLQALPADARAALAHAQVQSLRSRVLALVDESRGRFRRRLLADRSLGHKAPGRLLGGLDPSPLQPDAFATHSLLSRLRRLYPLASNDDAERLVRQWRTNLQVPEIEVARLEARLRELRAQLSAWAGSSVPRQRAVPRLIDAQRGRSMIQLADGTSRYALDLSNLGLDDLALSTLQLPDDFAHISELNLTDSPAVSTLPSGFTQVFTGLERLRLRNCSFTRIPQVARPDRVIWLDLDRNPLTWNATLQSDLDRYRNLRVLDFSDCPLTQAPDLSRHEQIRTLYMDNCLLPTLPVGLERLTDPLLLDFSRNPLVSLPAFQWLPEGVAAVMRLESDSLGALAAQQVEAYHHATGIDLLVPDSDYEELLAEADDGQLDVWARLPVAFRRDLRNLLESDDFLDALPYSRDEVWRRLQRADQDVYYRRRMLAQPATALLDRPMDQS